MYCVVYGCFRPTICQNFSRACVRIRELNPINRRQPATKKYHTQPAA